MLVHSILYHPKQHPPAAGVFQLALLQGSPSQVASGSSPLSPSEVGVGELLKANCEGVKLSPLRKKSLVVLHFILAGGSSALSFNPSQARLDSWRWPTSSDKVGTGTALPFPREDAQTFSGGEQLKQYYDVLSTHVWFFIYFGNTQFYI